MSPDLSAYICARTPRARAKNQTLVAFARTHRARVLRYGRVVCQADILTNYTEQNEAPSLLLTVSGTVAHYTPESLLTKPGNAPKSASATGSSKKKFDADAPLESHPRVFSQTFVLINGAGTNTEGGVPFVWTPPKSTKNKNQPQTDARTVAKYFVQADSFRFVG